MTNSGQGCGLSARTEVRKGELSRGSTYLVDWALGGRRVLGQGSNSGELGSVLHEPYSTLFQFQRSDVYCWGECRGVGDKAGRLLIFLARRVAVEGYGQGGGNGARGESNNGTRSVLRIL